MNLNLSEGVDIVNKATQTEGGGGDRLHHSRQCIQFNSIQFYSQHTTLIQGYKILYTKRPKKSNAYHAWAVKLKINEIKYNSNKNTILQMLKIRKSL